MNVASLRAQCESWDPDTIDRCRRGNEILKEENKTGRVAPKPALGIHHLQRKEIWSI